MKKIIWSMIFVFAAAILVYCADKDETTPQKQIPEAKQILLAGLKNQAETKGYQFEGKYLDEWTYLHERTTSTNTSLTTFNGIHQNPDLEKLTRKQSSYTMEEYMKNGKMAMRSQNNKWNVFQNSHFSFYSRIDVVLKFFCENTEDFKISGNEKINEIDCLIIESRIPLGKFNIISPYNRDNPDEIITTRFPVASCKIWIGRENKLPYKILVTYTKETDIFTAPEKEPGDDSPDKERNSNKDITKVRGPRITLYKSETYEMTFLNYDKDIEIQVPDELKKDLGM